jgi:hypothetical protein
LKAIVGEFCEHCQKFIKAPGCYQHIPKCDAQHKANKNLISNLQPIQDAQKRRDLAKREHGYSNLHSVQDYLDELNHELEKIGLKPKKEKATDELGFTPGFYRFIGLGAPNDYLHPLPSNVRTRITDMRKRSHLTMDVAQSFYTPMDNMYGEATGADTWYDYGRVPVSHLEVLSSKRLGALFTACNRPAVDILDNGYDFVKVNDPDGDPIDNDKIDVVRSWERKTFFHKKLTEIVDFDGRSGLGLLMVEKYLKEAQGEKQWRIKAPNTKPERFVTFSAYYMTPNNVYQPDHLDYDKQKWNFTGGLHAASNFHHSRAYVYEGIREPLGLRGLALGELSWVAWMCYLNTQYYILKALAQLGIVTVGINVDREFPTVAETAQYLALLKTMRANNFYVLGRGATLQVENAAGKLGSGINDFMEFLKEDVSAACVFPKNQMFGRSDGGGLDGAGAIVSKEDYLASNLSVKQSRIKHDIMWILQEMAGFTGLESYIPRFNIDLHKTQEQRFKEQLMKEQVEQTEMMTKQMKLQEPLMRKQVKLQKEMADVQLKMLKEDPEKLLLQSSEDEENLKTKENKPKKDFTTNYHILKFRYDMMAHQYIENDKLLKYMSNNAQTFKDVFARENEAYKRLFLKPKVIVRK